MNESNGMSSISNAASVQARNRMTSAPSAPSAIMPIKNNANQSNIAIRVSNTKNGQAENRIRSVPSVSMTI